MENEVKDCPWCGMPLELVSQWTKTSRVYDRNLGTMDVTETELATARCLSEHWFAAPVDDLVVG